MPIGLNGKLKILQQSPLDGQEVLSSCQPETAKSAIRKWVPSRFNIRATTEDGRLIIWNTFSGAMSVFEPSQGAMIADLLRKSGTDARLEGIVKYLVDRGFLIDQNANEYRQVQVAIHQQQFRTDGLELILLASEDCNLRCRYCYEKFARGTMLPWVRSGVKNLVRKRLQTLSRLQVSWFGGEPLYGFGAIQDLAPFFLETSRENGIAYYSHMTTNAYLLTPDIAEQLLAWHINDFQITVDGFAESHDHNRPTRDGEATFSQIFSNLAALARRTEEFVVSLRINFDQDNSGSLPEFVQLLERHFARDTRFSLNFYPIGRWGGRNDDQINVCGTREGKRLQRELKAEAHRRGLQIGTIREANQIGSMVCYAARPYNYIIGAAGQVMKCTIVLDTEDYNVVGSLNESGDIVLDPDKMALWTEPAFENDTRCQKCVVLPICQGTHCPLERIIEHKSPCCGIRSAPKRELLDVVEFRHEAANRIEVPQ